jgi:hypothetical protein
MSSHTGEERDLLAVLNLLRTARGVPVGCDGGEVLLMMNRSYNSLSSGKSRSSGVKIAFPLTISRA